MGQRAPISGAAESRCPPHEPLAIFLRQAEELANHGQWEGASKMFEQIDARSAAGPRHALDRFLGQPFEPRPQGIDALYSESLLHERPQPPVVGFVSTTI